MSQAKLPKPSVTTYADHEVITPPNPLRARVSRVNDPKAADDPVARAEAALAQLSSEFSTWMDEECEQLDRARREEILKREYPKGIGSPHFKNLVKVPLYDY